MIADKSRENENAGPEIACEIDIIVGFEKEMDLRFDQRIKTQKDGSDDEVSRFQFCM
jgi:tRNA A37 methylthiotransferase MiaB